MKQNEKNTVALIYGGRGCESEVSVRGAEMLLPLINREKYRPMAVFIDKNGRWLTGGGEAFPAYLGGIAGLCKGGEMIPISCAIPLLHGDYGEDGVVQGALQNAKIPFVGSDATSSAILCDKVSAKAMAQSLGIPTLPFYCVGSEEELTGLLGKLDYPVIVKPRTLGSSVGVSVASCEGELRLGVQRALSLCKGVIIEPYLNKPRELESAYFSAEGKEAITSPGEIIFSEGIYDYDKKYCNNEAKCSEVADVCEEYSKKIKEYSSALVSAIGIRDLCRIDFFLHNDRLYFNEINGMPGFTSESLYPRMLRQAGISPEELVDRLILSAIKRGG